MTDDALWMPLRAELSRWADAGRSVSLWLRDDDAVEPTPALARLAEITRQSSVPLTLAVIPAPTGDALASFLEAEGHVSVAVHGWTHTNHADAHSKKQELGLDRPESVVLDELRQGFDKLRALYPRRFVPMLVPPWNRIAAPLIPPLADIGYRALSVFGLAKADSPIPLVNTHVDVMDWHGTRGGRPHAELVRALVAELAKRFERDGEPVGILTHHLVHDETAWTFIEQLLRETAGHPAVRWRAVTDLIG